MVLLHCQQPKQLVRGAKRSTSTGHVAVPIASKLKGQRARCLQARAQKEMYGVLAEVRPGQQQLDRASEKDVLLNGYERIANVPKISREEAIMFQGMDVLPWPQPLLSLFYGYAVILRRIHVDLALTFVALFLTQLSAGSHGSSAPGTT